MITRLQMPAGKAVALAAMPTAVFMGLGLTPQLAVADSQPKGGFKPGPCVSQPDEADKENDKDEKSAKPSSKPSESEKAPEDKPEDKPAGESAPKPDDPEPGASPSPSESESKDSIDPLGLGSTLDGLLGGGDDAEPSATEEPKSSSETPAEGQDPVGKAGDTVGEVTDKAGETVDKAGDAVKDTADKAKDTVPAASSGPEAYPCPEHDAKSLADADYEPTSSLLPDKPWVLKGSKLTLHGLDYQGIVKVKTHNGTVKEVLKFTAKGVDLRDLHQVVEGPGGTKMHAVARKGSTSTIRDGEVTFYTEELRGNLFGIVPIVFSPKLPPPLNIHEVFFTDVSITQAGQFGGTLTVPGLNSYGTQS